ncbi:MAG TPA: preprotein translocase subunit SecG [Planctomycetota bacterium]
MGILFVLLSIVFIIICLLLVFMVVITPSNEGGMAAAFGGMGGDTFFGSKANQHINRFTIFLAVSFLVLAMALNRLSSGAATTERTKGRVETILEKSKPATPEMPLPGGAPPTPAPPK